MNKTIFITGASSGLGKSAAKLFQSKGWNVIASMRNPTNETELNKLENISLIALDVTSAEQTEQVVKEITARYSVDVVFNNAGYGLMGPLEALTDEQITRQFNTNLMGVIRVTRAFIPYFREKKNGLFITTTSVGGWMAFPLSSAYHATKWALEGWSESLWFELRNFGIVIKTVSPGGIKSDFAGRSLEFASSEPYESLIQKMTTNMGTVFQTASEPEQIAEVVYEAATNGKDQLRYIAGADAQIWFQERQQKSTEQFMQHINRLFIR